MWWRYVCLMTTQPIWSTSFLEQFSMPWLYFWRYIELGDSRCRAGKLVLDVASVSSYFAMVCHGSFYLLSIFFSQFHERSSPLRVCYYLCLITYTWKALKTHLVRFFCQLSFLLLLKPFVKFSYFALSSTDSVCLGCFKNRKYQCTYWMRTLKKILADSRQITYISIDFSIVTNA